MAPSSAPFNNDSDAISRCTMSPHLLTTKQVVARMRSTALTDRRRRVKNDHVDHQSFTTDDQDRRVDSLCCSERFCLLFALQYKVDETKDNMAEDMKDMTPEKTRQIEDMAQDNAGQTKDKTGETKEKRMQNSLVNPRTWLTTRIVK